MVDSIVQLVEALDKYGPALVITGGLAVMNIFFIWRDYSREKALQKEIAALQKVHNEIVLPLLTKCAEAIGECKEVIKQNSQIIIGLSNRDR
jgi:hypothetical protein